MYTQVSVPDRQFDEFSIVQEEYVVACEVSGVGNVASKLPWSSCEGMSHDEQGVSLDEQGVSLDGLGVSLDGLGV